MSASQPIPALSATTTLNALNTAVTLDMPGYSGVNFTLQAGTLAATLTCEISTDFGTTWSAWFIRGLATLTNFNASLGFTNPNAVSQNFINVPPGTTSVRVRTSVFTSGSAVGTLVAVSGKTQEVLLYAPDSQGSLQVLKADVSGNLFVSEASAAGAVTATGAAGAAVTATLSGISGYYHNISCLEIMAYNTAARTGGATPVLVTSTNLNGSNVWTFGSAGAIGTTESKIFFFPQPLRASIIGTATTIVCPATTSVIWRVNCFFRYSQLS